MKSMLLFSAVHALPDLQVITSLILSYKLQPSRQGHGELRKAHRQLRQANMLYLTLKVRHNFTNLLQRKYTKASQTFKHASNITITTPTNNSTCVGIYMIAKPKAKHLYHTRNLKQRYLSTKLK